MFLSNSVLDLGSPQNPANLIVATFFIAFQLFNRAPDAQFDRHFTFTVHCTVHLLILHNKLYCITV